MIRGCWLNDDSDGRDGARGDKGNKNQVENKAVRIVENRQAESGLRKENIETNIEGMNMRLKTPVEVIRTREVLVSRPMEMTHLSKPPDDKYLRLKDPLVDVSLAMEGTLHRIDQDLVIVPRDDEGSMLVESSDVVGSFGADD
ncbi:hypothetical protein PVK06_011260 [Gossypium arboreum]|uniref:Uncharacterized protein n=1 Tax=Gossypium arboreum TaxID=29729 RepID=A0ABR0Q9K3_GOSAR|nr:hypothetical protein PVK06_011260 [Gossypium arboreum]